MAQSRAHRLLRPGDTGEGSYHRNSRPPNGSEAYPPKPGSGRLCLVWRRKRMEERDGFDGCTMGGPGPTDRGVSPSQQNSAWFSLKGKVATQGSGEGRTSYIDPVPGATGRIHATMPQGPLSR